MMSVKLFYCVKLCDDVDCFNNHLTSIYKIEDHIKGCFKAHVIRDKLFNYLSTQDVTVSEATHMQYLDAEGFIRVASLASKETLPGSKVINFRLLSLSQWYYLTADVKPFELSAGAKSFLKAYTDHLTK